ncbi:MAG TPA: glycosyltransferase family 4 protein [Jatrophihabitans sp.]|nr:glycosyltransferase family 4 protein [Jatrophihabitans sp.]
MSPSRRLLLVTNDFPPRQGGIQSFLWEITRRLPPEQIAVYASSYHGSSDFDAGLSFPVRRHPTGLLIPTPAARSRVLAAQAEFGATSVWFGAAAPLGLLAPALRAGGAGRIVATTHGHEVGWAMLPGARRLLRRIADGVDVMTYLGEYTRTRLARVVGDRARLERLTPGVDTAAFNPAVSGDAVRQRYRLVGQPVVVCVSRLVPRKGQDALIEAWPAVRAQVPDARLLVVGGGRYARRLHALARNRGLEQAVTFTGSVPFAQLPQHFAAGDVFAMPCRTRRLGLDVEGLGMVFLEASATGLPVIAGDSGGAPDAVRSGETGFVVDGRNRQELTGRLVQLLREPERARRLGEHGRRWVERDWQWDTIAARLADLVGLN